MASFLIITKNQTKQKEELEKLNHKYGIDPLDQTVIEKDEDKKSLGIQDVKKMQQRLFLRPVKSENKGVFITDAHLLTIEAQNALLKILEEPPAHTIIALFAETKESFLPTIISRCFLIEPDQEEGTKEVSHEDSQTLNDALEKLPSMSIGQRLKLAETVARSREEAITWLEQAIVLLRKQIVGSQNIQQAQVSLLKSMQETHHLLKTTNVNVRLTLEHLFLSC